MREELAAAHEARDASESAREWLLQESLAQQRPLELTGPLRYGTLSRRHRRLVRRRAAQLCFRASCAENTQLEVKRNR